MTLHPVGPTRPPESGTFEAGGRCRDAGLTRPWIVSGDAANTKPDLPATGRGVRTARIGVIGAGIVGLAVARRLQQAMDVEVTVIDKESTVAAHQTSHNSNVVHSGVYYPPGSLKATLCRRGGEPSGPIAPSGDFRSKRLAKSSSPSTTTNCPDCPSWPERAKANGIPGSLVIDASRASST